MSDTKNTFETDGFNAANTAPDSDGSAPQQFSDTALRGKMLDNDHRERIEKERHGHEEKMRDSELGILGRFFGHSDNSSKNITFMILVMLVIMSAALITLVYCRPPRDCEARHIELIWNSLIPVVTLALGYLFGAHRQ